MSQAIIEITQVNKSFHGVRVLENINLSIKTGEFLTILGPSGCGKTTLLRLISGFEAVDSGVIRIAGKDVSGVSPDQRNVNTVFQSYALFPHMTVFENIAFGLRCKRVPEALIQEKVTNLLKIVRLKTLAERKPHQLSGGQQQRVAIARAAVNEPLVLLLDEPLSALDYSLRKNMQIELKTLQRKLGITFVLVTHDQEEALSISDRVVVMNHGVIEQVGTPREVYEKPANLAVATFVGEANIFETKVLSVADQAMQVRIENKVFALDNDCQARPGQCVSVLVRPEDLKAWDKDEMADKDPDYLIPASVEQVIYKGSTVDLILRTEGGKRISATEFFDEDDEDLDYIIGEKVWVEWMRGWEVVLPHRESEVADV
jgi:spermidine/putrescine transport system ATP-binding protein